MTVKRYSVLRRSLLLILVAVPACTEQNPRRFVTRTDSAGVEIVVSSATDTPLDWSFGEQYSLGGAADGPESFYQLRPELLGTDAAGRIHVLDQTSHRVMVFGADGRFIRTIGRQGGGPGELELPVSLDVTASGDVSVFDRRKMALVRWDSSGDLLPRIPFPHWPVEGRHFALKANGYLVAAGLGRGDWGTRLISVTGRDTTVLGATPPVRQTPGETRSCGGVIPFPPFFAGAVAWDHRNGSTAVVHDDEYRIDIWEGGQFVRSIRRPFPTIAATRELAVLEAGNGFTLPRGSCTVPPGDYADAKGWAETVPAIRELAVAANGDLYIQRWIPGPSYDPIDVFDPEGNYRGTLPEGTRFPALMISGDKMGIIRTDRHDVARLMVVTAYRSSAARAR